MPILAVASAMITDMSNRIVNVLQESPRFAETERAMIKKDLDISPELFTNKSAFINRVIALDNSFEKIEEKNQSNLKEKLSRFYPFMRNK